MSSSSETKGQIRSKDQTLIYGVDVVHCQKKNLGNITKNDHLTSLQTVDGTDLLSGLEVNFSYRKARRVKVSEHSSFKSVDDAKEWRKSWNAFHQRVRQSSHALIFMATRWQFISLSPSWS